MQTNETTTVETETQPASAPTVETTQAPVSNSEAAAKRVRAKRAPKQAPAKQAAKPTPAKPTQAAREQAQRDANDSRRLARDVAARAVAEFYAGPSKPFKAASDRFADLNPNNAKAPSVRQAGLLLALITYGRGNIKPTGQFVRGGFTVPAKLINANAKPGDTVRAQPESGCLGNMLGRTVRHVSGPVTGKAQAEAIFGLDAQRAIAEIQAAFGDKQAAAAATLLASYGVKLAKPAKRAPRKAA